MRVSSVTSLLYASLLMLSLSACTDRNLQIDFLSKAFNPGPDFTVTNNQGNGDMLLDTSTDTVLFEATCSNSIVQVDVQNSNSEWVDVTQFGQAGAYVDCVTQAKASFRIPIEDVAPYAGVPTTPGDQRAPLRLRLKVASTSNGETSYSYEERMFMALFKAPTVSITSAPNVNKTSTGNYLISGTCSLAGGDISYEIPNKTGSGSCISGSYTITLYVSDWTMEGTGSIEIKHHQSTSYRAYAKVQKNILVDRTAPTLAFTAPTGNITSGSLDANHTYQIAGTCSEFNRPVSIAVTGASTQTTSCSPAGTFTINVPVSAQGAVTITASQVDDAGNEGSKDKNLTISTVGPGSFSVTGIRSTNNDDPTSDGVLQSPGPLVDFSTSSGASSYDVVITNTGGTIVCATVTVTTSPAQFPSCSLSQGITYKVRAVARDASDNTLEAPSYSFNVQYWTPSIVSITSPTPNVIRKEGDVVLIDVAFNRPISASTPTISLNAAGTITYFGFNDMYTLRFSYTVSANQYASQLIVTAMTGIIADSVTTMPANLMVTGAELTSSNIEIDSVAPVAVTSLAPGPVQPYYDQTPTISYIKPAADPHYAYLASEVTLYDSMGTFIRSEMPHTSGTNLFGGAVDLNPGATYTIKVRIQDKAGNWSPYSQTSFVAFQCPTNFVYVGANTNFGTTPFCVGQSEAKLSSGKPVFDLAGTPILNSSLQDAMTGCSSLNSSGTNYDLISNAEWNALADTIVREPQNWSGGTAGIGMLVRGNFHNNAYGVAIDSGNPNYPDVTNAVDYRRSHKLPKNQEIWDISGNVSEFVKTRDNSFTLGADYTLVTDVTNGSFYTNYGARYTPSNPGSPSAGYGSFIMFNSSGGDVILRGGASNSGYVNSTCAGNCTGVFAAYRSGYGDGVPLDNTGYRCVYHP